jgi:YidC/Oxa1 family membrane protein insertase
VAASPLDQVISTPEEAPLPETLDPADALSSIPERIGYLKEVCGIDFGWGPSSMMEWLIEHIHIYGGFTWATSIVLLATFARLLIFIPMIRASDIGARIKAAQPILTPARERMRAAYEARDHRGMAEARAELKALQKEYKVNPFMMFIPVILQIPMQFGSFRTLRNMAELPVPAFEKENWLWTQDLTLGDPYFIIPAANAAIMYLTIKVCNWFTVCHYPSLPLNLSSPSEVVKWAPVSSKAAS